MAAELAKDISIEINIVELFEVVSSVNKMTGHCLLEIISIFTGIGGN